MIFSPLSPDKQEMGASHELSEVRAQKEKEALRKEEIARTIFDMGEEAMDLERDLRAWAVEWDKPFDKSIFMEEDELKGAGSLSVADKRDELVAWLNSDRDRRPKLLAEGHSRETDHQNALDFVKTMLTVGSQVEDFSNDEWQQFFEENKLEPISFSALETIPTYLFTLINEADTAPLPADRKKAMKQIYEWWIAYKESLDAKPKNDLPGYVWEQDLEKSYDAFIAREPFIQPGLSKREAQRELQYARIRIDQAKKNREIDWWKFRRETRWPSED